MIDTHTHLNLVPLIQDYREHYLEAQKAGVTQLIIPGVNYQSSEKAVEMSQELENVYAAIGLHPHEAEQLLTTQSTQEIVTWLRDWGRRDGVIAIGECGLDYYRLPDDRLQAKHQKAAQRKLFKLHIKVAKELEKPLLIHVRDVTETLQPETAHDDVIELLEKHQPKFVLHCFSGDEAYLKKALGLGGYISFAGNLTFKNANTLRKLATHAPLDRILCETDSPFLNPDRGQWPNTPEQVIQVYQCLSDLRNLSHLEIESKVAQNCRSLFKIETS